MTVTSLLETLQHLADQARAAAGHQSNATDTANLTELAWQLQTLVNTAWAQLEP